MRENISAAKVALSILLAILTFVAVAAFIALTVMRTENITKVISEADFATVIDETGLSEEIISSIDVSQFEDMQIDADSLKDFLKRENVSEEIGKIADKYLTAIAGGDFDYHITPEEIAGFLESVSTDIEEEFNYKLTTDDYDLIDKTLSNDELKEYSVGNLVDETSETGETSRYLAISNVLLSVHSIIIAGALSTFFAFCIFLLHRKRIRRAFLTLGIPLSLAGLAYTAIALLFGVFTGTIKNSDLYIIIQVAAGFADMLLVAGLICLGAGILALVLYFMIRKPTIAQNYL